MGKPTNLIVTRRGDDMDRVDGRYKDIAEHKGAWIEDGQRNSSAWIGRTMTLFYPDPDAPGNYCRVEMQGAEVDVYRDTIYAHGFVHVNPETGDPIRFAVDDHSGVYRREYWSQRVAT